MNKHIKEYLDYYCNLESPSYAVLLKGQWGCGKSHFIDLYQRESKKKFIYISLYGLKETTQIDDALFQSTNPRLGSKGMGVASKIIASSLKSVAKVDVSSSSTYLKKLLSKTKDSILIFDDLERTDIPLKQVFGYINDFVEHEKRHVIIIADVSKIKEGKYLLIKEKLIGQELEVQLDIEEAFTSFCTSVKNETCKTFLNTSFPNICYIYKASGYNNLRTLRKVIQDFEWIFDAMPTKAHTENDLLQDVLNTLLILSLEIRSGNIKEQDIKELFKVSLDSAKKEGKLSPLIEIKKKYSLPYSPILGEKLWQNFFETGAFNKESLYEAVFNSQYFQSLDQESWVRLVSAVDANDEEFDSIKEEVFTALRKKEYKHVGVIKHVFGVFLWMADNGLLEKTEDEVQIYFQQYVDELAEEKSIEFEENDSPWNNESFAGLAFWSRERKEFQDFCTYLATIRSRQIESTYPVEAEALLEKMVDNVELFGRELVLSNSSDQKYFRIPILKHVKPESFMDALDKAGDQRRVGEVIRRRYEFDNFNKDLLEELGWLESLKALLEEEIEQRKGKVSGYRYKNILNLAVIPAIEKLQAIKSELEGD